MPTVIIRKDTTNRFSSVVSETRLYEVALSIHLDMNFINLGSPILGKNEVFVNFKLLNVSHSWISWVLFFQLAYFKLFYIQNEGLKIKHVLQFLRQIFFSYKLIM